MIAYSELHCKTNYSFLEGASHADELVATARGHGYAALAVTDRDSLAGVVRAHVAAKEQGLKLIVGAEIHPRDAPTVVLWAPDRRAYGRLCRLITVGRRRAEKGECDLGFEDIAAHAEGLLAGVVPSFSSPFPSHREEVEGRGKGESRAGRPRPYNPDVGAGSPRPSPHSVVLFRSSGEEDRTVAAYRDLFGDRAYLLAELFRGPDDARRESCCNS